MRRAPQPVRPSEIAQVLNIRPNTLSVYLAILTRADLTTAAREGRSIVYRLDRRRIARLIAFLAEDCCRGRPEICLPVRSEDHAAAAAKAAAPFQVLFPLLRQLGTLADGGGDFEQRPVGALPSLLGRRSASGRAEPSCPGRAESAGHDTSRLGPKNVSEFRQPDAPRFDFVFTLCDHAANEECPAWPGLPITAHWGLTDPAAAAESCGEGLRGFQQAYRILEDRLPEFKALPFATLDRIALQREVDAIGTGTRRDVERVS